MRKINVALRKPMSLNEFLAWEERQELRYEFDGLQAVATGGTSSSPSRTPAAACRRSHE
jgi:hypothetical protein